MRPLVSLYYRRFRPSPASVRGAYLNAPRPLPRHPPLRESHGCEAAPSAGRRDRRVCNYRGGPWRPWPPLPRCRLRSVPYALVVLKSQSLRNKMRAKCDSSWRPPRIPRRPSNGAFLAIRLWNPIPSVALGCGDIESRSQLERVQIKLYTAGFGGFAARSPCCRHFAPYPARR